MGINQDKLASVTMHPMRYDKLLCAIPEELLTTRLGGDIYEAILQMLTRDYGDITMTRSGTVLTKTIYAHQGVHLLTIVPSNSENSLSISMYGVNTWEMGRWVLKELGDLKITRIDICVDYTGDYAWQMVIYKLEVLAGKRAVDLKEAPIRMRSLLANSLSTYKPMTMAVPINRSARIIAYEKGRKMLNDMEVLGGTTDQLDLVDNTWTRLELQSYRLNKPLSTLDEAPLTTWMSTRGEQWMMDRLFYLEHITDLQGASPPVDLTELFKKWFDIPSSIAGLDSWVGLRKAAKPDVVALRLVYEAYYMLRHQNARDDVATAEC